MLNRSRSKTRTSPHMTSRLTEMSKIRKTTCGKPRTSNSRQFSTTDDFNLTETFVTTRLLSLRNGPFNRCRIDGFFECWL